MCSLASGCAFDSLVCSPRRAKRSANAVKAELLRDDGVAGAITQEIARRGRAAVIPSNADTSIIIPCPCSRLGDKRTRLALGSGGSDTPRLMSGQGPGP